MYLYPKWIRLWHWLNALMFIILIVTGLSMQYTDKEQAAYVVRFAIAVKWHNFAAMVLVLNYIVFVTGNILTRNGRYYKIRRENFSADLLKQLKYYALGNVQRRETSFPGN